MTRHWVFAVLTAFVLAGSALAAPADPIDAAVADPARPADDVKRDAMRKPAEMLAFAEVKPGMKVMDMIPGRGYFTRLFAKAVGPDGRVYAYWPNEWNGFLKGKPAPIDAVATEYKNVTVIKGAINELNAPEPLDIVWTSQNYHDLKNNFAKPADTATVNRAVFNALKPGGIYIVLDHSAVTGSGSRDTDSLHRIEQDTVKKEVLEVGFEYVGENNSLANPADARDKSVFDESLRGRTDQFVLKFRKPAQ